MGRTEVFSNSTQLHFDPKGLSTFIQTDKLNYMPGQAVKFRAVSIHPDGKPYVSPVDIIIRVSRTSIHSIRDRTIIGVNYGGDEWVTTPHQTSKIVNRTLSASLIEHLPIQHHNAKC